jgi:N-acetylmuramoyl-L-alanine amidase
MPVKPLLPEDIKYIVVHCSATPPNQDIGVPELDRMHRDRGFAEIGYHFVIRRDGAIEGGRDIHKRGAHVENYNHCSIGICMVGGVDSKLRSQNNFTPEQFNSLATLLYGMRDQYPDAVIQGHRDFPNVAKDCPCFNVRPWVAENL